MKRSRRRGRKRQEEKRVALAALLAILCVAVIGVVLSFVFWDRGASEDSNQVDVLAREELEEEEAETAEAAEKPEAETEEEAEDPQSEANMVLGETGAEAEVVTVLVSDRVAETEKVTIGIDVSKFQGTIDWQAVAEAGVEFAMVRVGYRTQSGGEIMEDTNARYNMQEAAANGIQIGAYFFSTAISQEEAVEEAVWVADYISQYPITYPVAYNCEGFENPDNRQYSLSAAQRTDFAEAFLHEIYRQGYTPMFYASKNEMEGDLKWETSRLDKSFKIWVSQYPAEPFPQTAQSSYSGIHAMWQYTNNGTVAGIDKPVDLNLAYFGYEEEAEAQNQEAPERAEADVEALMHFEDVEETVTAKDVVNLRDIPSQGEDSTVLTQLGNGETALRTGISDSGWSRLLIDGERYYAVSNYLTTDLSYQPPVQEPDDGLKTKFTTVSEHVTPKIEVNLRKLPSVTNPDAVVVATVKAGEVFVRTGINTDHGWSRVEYNGEILYCVSSYLNVVQ